MNINLVVDTSAILAVLLNDDTKSEILQLTQGSKIFAPHSLYWEVGNAISAMFKRNRITLPVAQKLIKIFEMIPISFLNTEFETVLSLCYRRNIYAYDAYFIVSAIQTGYKLLSIDNGMIEAAKHENIEIPEV